MGPILFPESNLHFTFSIYFFNLKSSDSLWWLQVANRFSHWIHWFPSDHRSWAVLSLVSTWMGNRQETLGAVGSHPQQCNVVQLQSWVESKCSGCELYPNLWDALFPGVAISICFSWASVKTNKQTNLSSCFLPMYSKLFLTCDCLFT